MELLPQPPTRRGSPATTTGEVWADDIVSSLPHTRLRMASVTFCPGARTAWHCHAHGQTLYVTAGRGLVGTRDGEVRVLLPGDVVVTPPGEWHWHGASPAHAVTHISVTEDTGSDREATTWGEQVSAEQYAAAPSQARSDRT